MRYQKSSNKLLGDDPNRLSLTILTLSYAKPHCRQSKSLAPNVKLIVKYLQRTANSFEKRWTVCIFTCLEVRPKTGSLLSAASFVRAV